MLNNLKIGILGGSFSPVHNGHIFLARYVKDECGLDEVIMIPTGIHPFKGACGMPEATHRLKMLELATEKEEGLSVSDIEVKSNEVSYTYVTLCKLREKYGKDCRIYFIVGTDELLELDRWYKAESLMKEFSFIVGIRPGYGKDIIESKIPDLNKRFGADINVINLPAPDVSSTQVREAIAQNKDLSAMLPKQVNEYIKTNKLYR